jgi:hypothetical protein
MFDPFSTVKLSMAQVLEALGDTNRFFTSHALQKPFFECTTEECIKHYISNTPIGMTVYGHDVFPAQPAGDMAYLDLDLYGGSD